MNQLGGLYINGKPLPKETRQEIVDLARLGVRPCDISRQLKITHGCISKLLSKYQKTGSVDPGGANVGRPRVITPQIEQKIEQYRREQPGIFSWELRDRLLRENVCSRENLPSLSSISRLIKQRWWPLLLVAFFLIVIIKYSIHNPVQTAPNHTLIQTIQVRAMSHLSRIVSNSRKWKNRYLYSLTNNTLLEKGEVLFCLL